MSAFVVSCLSNEQNPYKNATLQEQNTKKLNLRSLQCKQLTSNADMERKQMEELQIKVSQQQGSITTNFDAIEAGLKEFLATYKDIVVTEDSIKESKKDLAELRKVKTSIDDARKNTKKQWLAPYEEFEAKCKGLVALVDEPINLINDQLKLFEEDRIAQKREHIKELYASIVGDLEKFLPFDKVYNTKWENVSVKDKDIIYDLQEMTLKVKNDLMAIQALGSEIEQDCIDTYARFGNDLSMAIQRNSQYLADKNKVVSQVKEEVREEIKAEVKVETPKETDKRMIKFVVSGEDAEQVRWLLTSAGIIFGEE